MITEFTWQKLRTAPEEPWPQYEAIEPVPLHPKQGFKTLTELWSSLTVIPVDENTPVTDPLMVDKDVMLSLLTIYIPTEPTYAEGWDSLSTTRQMAGIFHAFKFRSMLQLKAFHVFPKPNSKEANEFDPRTFRELEKQRLELLKKWHEGLGKLGETEKVQLAQSLKKLAGGWKYWAEI